MYNFSVICLCGAMSIPLKANSFSDTFVVQYTYCPFCIEIHHPITNFPDKVHMLDHSDPRHEDVLYPIDEKTLAAYSTDIEGFFGVRYRVMAIDGMNRCRFRTPFSANAERVPLCLRGCKNLKAGNFELRNDGFWYLSQTCMAYNKDISEAITFACEKFR